MAMMYICKSQSGQYCSHLHPIRLQIIGIIQNNIVIFSKSWFSFTLFGLPHKLYVYELLTYKEQSSIEISRWGIRENLLILFIQKSRLFYILISFKSNKRASQSPRVRHMPDYVFYKAKRMQAATTRWPSNSYFHFANVDFFGLFLPCLEM